MTPVTLSIAAIVLLFAIAVTLRSVVDSFQICALCASVSATWITLLALLQLGYSVDPILIGILMGASITGLLNLLEEKLPERSNLFKLPVFLTLLVLAYFVLEGQGLYYGIIIIGLLWVFSLTLFANRNTDRLKTLTRNIIQCCKNW